VLKFTNYEMQKDLIVDKLVEYSDKCVNMYDLCIKLGLESVGGNTYKEIRKIAKEIGVDLKFSYKRNVSHHNFKLYPNLEDVLIENSPYISLQGLKRRLIKEGYKENKCECCNITTWNGKEISLQLHHINGNRTDNRIENLQILCPNCHSQTETYAGKNANRTKSTKVTTKKHSISHDDWVDIRNSLWEQNHPSKERLIELFKITKSFLGLSKLYDVSDKAIIKWFKHYGLPYKKKELCKYIEDNNL